LVIGGVFLARYRKGANAERELIQMLYKKGFSVVRVAGSGATSLPCPDCVALSKKKKMAFECKAWSGNYLHLPVSQMDELAQWSNTAGIDFFVAWKIPREGWVFLGKNAFHKSDKNYSINKKGAKKHGLVFSVLVDEQKRLRVKQ